MYTIFKVLNHNALMVTRGNNYYLVLDKGIGFKRKADECISLGEYSTVYELKDQKSSHSDPIFLEITNEIIQAAKVKFPDIDTNILLPLSDHISFAIERIQKDLIISNPFTEEIRLLNPEEYSIALQARDLIKKYTDICINDDEVGYITLHIHSAISNTKVNQSILLAQVVQDSLNTIHNNLNIQFDSTSLAYSRLITHIKYMIKRIETNEKLTLDMDEFILNQYPIPYRIAEDIIKDISISLQCSIPRIEVGYLALHIQRVIDIS